jgi:hypothetical protein
MAPNVGHYSFHENETKLIQVKVGKNIGKV